MTMTTSMTTGIPPGASGVYLNAAQRNSLVREHKPIFFVEPHQVDGQQYPESS